MISVIIPTYNRASNIKRAMLSVLGQSYSDIELIVIDDGSTDDTEVVVNSISDSRVRYYRQEKQGACAARNLGIHLAKGDYIAFQDSDDEWLENKLEKQIQYMEKTGADLAAHAFTRFSFKKEGTVERIPDAEYPSGRVQYAELVTGNFCSTQTLMVKKVCFNEELFDITYPRLQDWELVLRLSEKWKLYFDNEVYANVYVQKNSISRDMISS